MAKRTRTQKHNLHAVEEVDEVTSPQPQETLNDFLREVHQESTVSAAPPTLSEGDRQIPSLLWLRDNFKTKSAIIRYLHGEGYAVKDISKHTGIRYQHVRNVLTTELKRGPNEPHNLTNSVTNSVKISASVEKRFSIQEGDDAEEEDDSDANG